MKRLTKWIEGLEQARISCKICGKTAIYECWSQENCTQTAVDRLAAIEDILGDDYDLERLKVMMTQCMSMREEVSERFRITGSIPVERLRELVEADKAGRCVVIPENYDGAMFRVWKNQILSSEKFAWMMKKLGKSFFLTHKAAEAALAKEADHE